MRRHSSQALNDIFGSEEEHLVLELVVWPKAGLGEFDGVLVVRVDRLVDEVVAVGACATVRNGSDPRSGLLLGYGAIDTDQIEPGLNRLKGCFAEIPS